jgi:hypothetical protein
MDIYKRPSITKQFTIEVKCMEARSDDTFSPPILISTLFSPHSEENRNFQIKLLGGIFGITRIMYDKNKQPYRYYWKNDEDLFGIFEPAKSITTYPLPFFDGDKVYPLQIMIYQDTNSATAYINGKFLSEKKFKATPGQIIFNDLQPFESGMELTLSNSSILTGKLAWRTKEVLTQSADVHTSGVNPFADKFDINLSGGINQSKERRGKNANEVAEAQVNYQTIEVKVRITPLPDSGLTYPALVNVNYSYSYTEQWQVNHYIWGNINQEFERKDSVNRQYLLESPSSVIEDTYTVEYAESVVSSDFTETAKLKLKSDPVINVNVTGVALDPKK